MHVNHVAVAHRVKNGIVTARYLHMAKKIIIKKKSTQKKTAGDTYADMPQDVPQLRTRKLKAPKPKIVLPESEQQPAEEPEQKPMRFKFYCIRCGQKLEADAAWVGRQVNCTTCNSLIEIPEPPE